MKTGSLRQWARKLKQETRALMFAYRDDRTPWYAKAFAAMVVAYALSPIDLIPDFIPVLGYLDDLILVPAGIFIAIRLVPREVMDEARARAAQESGSRQRHIGVAVAIVVIWVAVLAVAGVWIYGMFWR